MLHIIASRPMLGFAMLVAAGCLMLTGCGPDLPSYSAIKQELDVLPAKDQTPILTTLADKYLLDFSKAAIDEKKGRSG